MKSASVPALIMNRPVAWFILLLFIAVSAGAIHATRVGLVFGVGIVVTVFFIVERVFMVDPVWSPVFVPLPDVCCVCPCCE